MTTSEGGDRAPPAKGGRAQNLRRVRQAIIKAAPLPGMDHVALPPGFEMREDGLWRRARSENERDMRLTGPFEVLAESRPEGGDEWGLLLRWNDRDGRPHEWIMPRRLLAGEAVAVRERLIACGLDIAASDAARRALLLFLSDVRSARRVRTVPRCGWFGHPPRAYVLPDAVFGQTAEAETLRLDLEPAPTTFRQAGTLAGWRDQVAALCVGNTRLIFAVSAAFAAAVLPLLGEEGGGINLRGESSKGKTTIIDVAASVWGAPSKTGPEAFVRPWRATSNAIESVAMAHNHALLPMDELGQADPKEIGETLYMLANGVGKERARASGGNRPKATWSTLVLSSSEESAASLAAQAGKRLKAGQEVRLLDVPAVVERGHGAFETLHGADDGAAFARLLRHAAVHHHGHAIRAFLEYLAGQLAERDDFIVRSLADPAQAWERRHVPDGADGQVRRAARRFAVIAVAGELATRAKVTGWSQGAAAGAAAAILQDWLSLRGGIGSREDQHLFAALRRFIGAHGAARFETARDPSAQDGALASDLAVGAQTEPELPEGARIIQRAGWRWQEAGGEGHRHWVYGILPEVFAAEVSGPIGFEEREACARLARAKLIRTAIEGGERRYRVRTPWRVAGVGRPRLIVVETARLLAGAEEVS
jgi:putative DNA primase/helicase